MCGHSATSSRSPPSAPLAPAADRFQEVVCAKTSGEAVTESQELLLVTRREDLQCRGECLLGRLYVLKGSVVILFCYRNTFSVHHQRLENTGMAPSLQPTRPLPSRTGWKACRVLLLDLCCYQFIVNASSHFEMIPRCIIIFELSGK